MSLVFYGYGEPAFIKILIVSVFANWAAGWVVGEHARFRKLAMWASVAANVGLLFYFKYLAFGVGQINACFGTAWRVPDIVLPLGISFFTFQIFFDFSGYSDMAIGLGRMFGFHFLENFDHPYVSRSVSEFWRRWHISMGTWFRDYVYFPLGGSRSATRTRNLLNLFVVWTLTGIWHGANWTFLVWGLMYFVLIACEKLLWTGRREVPGAITSVFGWAYTMFFVMVGWVFFRRDESGARLALPGHPVRVRRRVRARIENAAADLGECGFPRLRRPLLHALAALEPGDRGAAALRGSAAHRRRRPLRRLDRRHHDVVRLLSGEGHPQSVHLLQLLMKTSFHDTPPALLLLALLAGGSAIGIRSGLADYQVRVRKGGAPSAKAFVGHVLGTMEEAMPESLRYPLITFNGAFQRMIGRRTVSNSKDLDVVRLANGHLARQTVWSCREANLQQEADRRAAATTALQASLAEAHCLPLLRAAAAPIDPACPHAPAEPRLCNPWPTPRRPHRASGVDAGRAQRLHDQGLSHDRLFFKTDHHLTPEVTSNLFFRSPAICRLRVGDRHQHLAESHTTSATGGGTGSAPLCKDPFRLCGRDDICYLVPR